MLDFLFGVIVGVWIDQTFTLPGSYMGHTANKTKKLLQKHAGGVIFIR